MYRDNLTDSRSLLFKQLQRLTDIADKKQAEADWYRELNREIVYRVQDGTIKSDDDITCALAWAFHCSRMSFEEIFENALDN